jgi:hypothetical protein
MGRIEHLLLDGAPLTSASSILCLSRWSHTVHRLGIELAFSPALVLAIAALTYHAPDPPP